MNGDDVLRALLAAWATGIGLVLLGALARRAWRALRRYEDEDEEGDQ